MHRYERAARLEHPSPGKREKHPGLCCQFPSSASWEERGQGRRRPSGWSSSPQQQTCHLAGVPLERPAGAERSLSALRRGPLVTTALATCFAGVKLKIKTAANSK